MRRFSVIPDFFMVPDNPAYTNQERMLRARILPFIRFSKLSIGPLRQDFDHSADDRQPPTRRLGLDAGGPAAPPRPARAKEGSVLVQCYFRWVGPDAFDVEIVDYHKG